MRLIKIKPIQHRKPHNEDNLPTIVRKNGIIMKHIHVMDVQISTTVSTKP